MLVFIILYFQIKNVLKYNILLFKDIFITILIDLFLRKKIYLYNEINIL